MLTKILILKVQNLCFFFYSFYLASSLEKLSFSACAVHILWVFKMCVYTLKGELWTWHSNYSFELEVQKQNNNNKMIHVYIYTCVYVWKAKSLSRVRLFATPRTVTYQAPLSMGFSGQAYWSGVPLPSVCICICTHKRTILWLCHFVFPLPTKTDCVGVRENNPAEFSLAACPLDF